MENVYIIQLYRLQLSNFKVTHNKLKKINVNLSRVIKLKNEAKVSTGYNSSSTVITKPTQRNDFTTNNKLYTYVEEHFSIQHIS